MTATIHYSSTPVVVYCTTLKRCTFDNVVKQYTSGTWEDNRRREKECKNTQKKTPLSLFCLMLSDCFQRHAKTLSSNNIVPLQHFDTERGKGCC